MPPGARFDAERGRFTWTPTAGQAGQYPGLRFSASDGTSTVTQSVRLIVQPSNVAPVLRGIPDRVVLQGDPLRFTLRADDPDSSTITYAGVNLPPGATLHPVTGVFEWTPPFDLQGSFDLVFTASDGQASGQRTVRVNVVNVNAPPVFDDFSSITVTEGQPLTLRLFAFDPDNPGYVPQVRLADGTLSTLEGSDPTVTYAVSALPAGASFDPVTSLLMWTPSFSQAGSHVIEVTAVDDGNGTGTPASSRVRVPVLVTNVNRVPTLEQPANVTLARGEVVEVPVSAADEDGNALSLDFSGLPGYATFIEQGPGSGVLRFAPGLRDRGNAVITITARDDGDGEGSARALAVTRSFVVTVTSPAEPPLLQPIGDKVAVIGQALGFTVRATDLDQDALTISASGLPAGATLTPGTYGTARVNWTPGAGDVGSRPVTFTVTDSAGLTDTQTLALIVRASNASPLLAPVGDRTIAEGATLSLQLAASDADGDALRYSASGLPPGARLDAATGLLTWTPGFESAGTYADIVLGASDGTLESSETIRIVVTPTNRAPQIVPISPVGGQERSQLQFTLVGADPDGDVLAYRAVSPLPRGARFDGRTGSFIWTPDYDQAGVYALEFAARDLGGLEAQRTVQLTIDDVNRPPALSFTNHRVALGETMRFTIAGSDLDTGEVLRFGARDLPEGATLDAVSGEVTWRPEPGQIGEHFAVISLTDGKSTVTRGLALRVDPLAVGPAVTIVLTPSFPAIPGQPVTITVLADAFSGVATRSLAVDGVALALDDRGRAVFTPSAIGLYRLTASATDLDGYSGSAVQTLRVRDAADVSAPQLVLDPTLGGRRIDAATSIRAAVVDRNLESWSLEIAPLGSAAESPAWRAVASGSTTTGSSTAVLGTLASLDPAQFARGFYTLRLRAQDVAGRQSETSMDVELAAVPAASRYTRSDTDFSIDFGGRRLEFVRRYDVQTATASGLLGYGWRSGLLDLDVQTDVPPTGAETSGVWNPLREGSRVVVTTPDGQRMGFTFTPREVRGRGFGYFVPEWTPDAGNPWRLSSADMKLQAAAGSFYSLTDGTPYNPDALAGSAVPYTLTGADGTRYDIDPGRGNRGVTFSDGTRWVVADSGIVAADGSAVGFVRDTAGRLTSITLPDGRQFIYQYDRAGNLASVRDLAAGQAQRLGYADPQRHLLTLVTTPTGGEVISHEAGGARVLPVRENLGAALAYLNRPVSGSLAGGAVDHYTFAVRESEVALPQGGAFLLAVEVTATDPGALQLALPQVDGAAPVLQAVQGGRAFAVYRFAEAGMHTLRVAGTGSGAYTVRLLALGDLDGDQRVDAQDAALLRAARGSVQGQSGYLAAADLDRDGDVDVADSQLFHANLGFSPNAAPRVATTSILTHVELETTLAVASLLSDPEGDATTFRIVGASNGTARVSGDGSRVTFSPQAGYAGEAGFTIVADDGFSVSAPGTVTVRISDAPLIRIGFAERTPQIGLGNTWRPVVLGDFADQIGVELPASYVQLSVTDESVASVLSNSVLLGKRQGFAALVARRGTITGATAVVTGEPSRFEEVQLVTGIDVYPNALTLVPEGGSKPLQVNIVDGEVVTAAVSGTMYFAGNPDVVRVGPDGLITSAAAGTADVTVIYRGTEFVVPVRVQAPAAERAVLGAEGGTIRASDGAVIAIPPNALEGTTEVSLRPVAVTDLPMAMPPGWTALAAYDLRFDGDALTTPAQLAIRVPESIPVGKQVFLLRYGHLPDEAGNLRPIWWQDEVAVVGDDHIARTSSPPWPGVEAAGVYALAEAPAITYARGRVTVNFPIGSFPIVATLSGVMATVSPVMAVTLDVSRIDYVAIPETGLPVVTSVGVRLNPDTVNDVSVVVDRPQRAVPKAPVILGATFGFREIDGQTTPVAIVTGIDLASSPESALSSRLVGVWRQQGKSVEAEAVGSVTMLGDSVQQVTLRVPQSVIAGIADLAVVRIDTAIGWDECARQVTTSQKAYASSRVRLPALTPYVASALWGVTSDNRAQSQVALFTQGDPFADDPAAQLQLVARIPVGKAPGDGVPFGSARSTALTPDQTRAYVTLRGQGTVAIVDLLAKQQADAKIGNAPPGSEVDPVDQITLVDDNSPPPRPFWIVTDSLGKYAYVSDERDYGSSALTSKGRIYVIDIDPASATFHQRVDTIEIDAAGDGLRQLVVSNDGKRLYAAAPNRVPANPQSPPIPGASPTSFVVVVNIDSEGRQGTAPCTPSERAPESRGYRKQIARFETGKETYALQVTPENDRLLYANRGVDDPAGVGTLRVISDDPLAFDATVTPSTRLSFGKPLNSMEVNNAQSLLVLPADTFKDVMVPFGGSGSTLVPLGPHPEYVFVGAFNKFAQGDPQRDPDAWNRSNQGRTPAGSNIGVVRGGQLIAATLPIPLGSIDNLAFASGFNYLFAAYRGLPTAGVGDGAVMVYNLVNLVSEVEFILKNGQSNGMAERLKIRPIDATHYSNLLPLQEDLQGLNTFINIKSDYRVLRADERFARFLFAVPYVMDGNGNYVGEQGQLLSYRRGGRGQLQKPVDQSGQLSWVDVDPATDPMPKVSPSAPFGTGGLVQGLSAHKTETAPGPRIANQFALGRKLGIAERNDLSLQDVLDEINPKQDCPDDKLSSVVQLDTGAVVETHDLVSYQSLGQTQQLQLVHNSMSADAMPIITFGWDNVGTELSQYLAKAKASELSSEGNAILEVQVTFNGLHGTLTGPAQYWQIAPDTEDFTVSVQTDLSSLPSGYYNYTVNAKLFGKERKSEGALMLDNRIDSAFGRGWTLSGLQELSVGTDGTVQISESSGNQQPFDRIDDPVMDVAGCGDPNVKNRYTSRQDPYSTLEELIDGTFRRRLKDGTEYGYSAPSETPDCKPISGKLMYVKDRYGNKTVYAYDIGGRIESITDPVGIETRFEYSGDRVSSIKHPGDRTTTLVYEGGMLSSIEDPDGSTRSFTYDDKGRMKTEITKLGALESTEYGFHGRARESTRIDGSKIRVDAWQVQALSAPETTSERAAPAFVKTGSFETQTATYTYANGNFKQVTFNERGQVLTEVDKLGLVERFERDAQGNVLRFTNEDGDSIYTTYDERGNRLTVRDDESESGKATVFTYEGRFNRVSSVTDERGFITRYFYNSKGDVETIDSPEGGDYTYTYWPQGMQKTATDGRGNTTKFFYDARGRLARVENPDQTTRLYTYYEEGNVETATDEEGRITTFFYDEMNRLIRTERPKAMLDGVLTASTVEMTYDEAGNLLTSTDANGNPTTMTYDKRGRMLTSRDALGGTKTWYYNDREELEWVEDERGFRTEYTYDERYRLRTEKDAEGNVTEYKYELGGTIEFTDGHGRIETYQLGGAQQATEVINARSYSTFYEYDGRTRLVKVTDAYGRFDQTFYDASNNVVRTIDRNGHQTRFEYDGMGRRRFIYDHEDHVTEFVYDEAGNLWQEIDARRNVTEYFYDSRNRRIATKNARGDISRVEYDGVGNRRASIDEKTSRTRYVYDALDRLISTTRPDPDGLAGPESESVTRMEYDLNGNLRKVTDPLGRETFYSYDELNRRTSEKNAKGGESHTEYDETGNVSATVDVLGRRTEFEYDKVNRNTKVKRQAPNSTALTTVTEMKYDEVGNLVEEKDPLLRTTRFEYDRLDRREKTIDALGFEIREEYDWVGNLRFVTDQENRRVEHVYDSLNRRIRTIEPAVSGVYGHAAPVTEYGYDAVGNRTSVKDALDFETVYGYDKLNRVESVRDALGRTARRSYDSVGNLETETDELRRVTSYFYDNQNRLIRIERPDPDGLGAQVAPIVRFGYDAVGNQVLRIDERGFEHRTTYDELNRRIGWTDPLLRGGTITLDAAGRIREQTDERQSITKFEYDNLDRMTKITLPDPDDLGPLSASVTQFEYDLVGNLVRRIDPRGNDEVFRYDALNRLVETRDADYAVTRKAATATYDRVGNLKSRTDRLDRVTTFDYDELDRRVTMTEPGSDVDRPEVTTRVTQYRYDKLGQLIAVLDARNNLTRFDYDALGRQFRRTDPLQRFTEDRYDEVGNIIEQRDVLGRLTKHVYDDLDRRIATLRVDPDARGGMVEFMRQEYDAAGNVTASIDAEGRRTEFEHDELGRLKLVKDAYQNTDERYYDEVGNLVRSVDRRGRETLFEYDRLNRMTKRTEPDPDGRTGRAVAAFSEMAYDRNGNLVAVTDVRGHTTQYGYDKLNRRNLVIDARGSESSMEYDVVGNLKATVDRNQRRTEYGYDTSDRLVSVTAPKANPLGTGDDLVNPVTRFAYDIVGNRVLVIDPNGNSTRAEYDAINRVLKQTDALLRTVQTEYDAAGNVQFKVDEKGRKTRYAYDEWDRLIKVTFPRADGSDGAGPPTGDFIAYTYDRVGNRLSTRDELNRMSFVKYDKLNRAVETTDALDHKRKFTYDEVDNLIFEEDALQRVTEHVYDDLDRRILTRLPDPDGNGIQLRPEHAFEYDEAGNLIAQVDARGFVTRYNYDELNRRDGIIDVRNALTQFTYDPSGNLRYVTDARGAVTHFDYDNLDRRTRIVYADPDASGPLVSPVAQFRYDLANNLVETVDPRLNVTSYGYDALNRQVSMTDALEQTSRIEFDEVGNVSKRVDALSRETAYSYDARNRLVRIDLPDPDLADGRPAPFILYEYDAVGNRTATVDELNRRSTVGYDALDRAVLFTDPLTHTRELRYDEVGNLRFEIDELSRQTEHRYDALDRRTQTTAPDPDGAGGPLLSPVTRFEYDAQGNLVARIDPRGNPTQLGYDELNRLDRVIDAVGTATRTRFDSVGNIASVTVSAPGEVDRVTSYGYDVLNRRTLEVQPDPDGDGPLSPPYLEWSYDAAGNVVAMADARGFITSYGYDALNRRTSVTNALNQTTSVTFDAVGNVEYEYDALQRETKRVYDRLNRMISLVQPDPDGPAGALLSPVTRYAYFDNGTVRSITDPLLRTTRFEYDALDRRTAVVDASDNRATTTYDAVGNVLSTTDVLDRTTQYRYDRLDRLVETTLPDPDGSGKPQLPPVTGYAYDDAGNLISVTDPLGHVTRYRYDALNRRDQVTDARGKVTTSRFDGFGNLIEVTDPLLRTVSYGYDRLNRQVSMTLPDPDGTTGPQVSLTTRFEYDAAGNRVRTIDPRLVPVSTITYDPLGRRQTETDALGGQTIYDYDAVGNLRLVEDAAGNVTTFSYDALRRLTRQTDELNNARSFEYDAAGQRTSMTDALGRRTVYGYDNLGRNDSEQWYSSSGALVRTIAREYDAAGQLTSVVEPDVRYTIGYDFLGRMTRIDNTGSAGLVPVALAYGYDEASRLRSVGAEIAGAADWITRYDYDETNHLTEVAQAGGQALDKRVTLEYDDAGQLTTVRRFDGTGITADIVSAMSWDRAGRLNNISHADSSGATLASYGYTWDDASRLTGIVSVDGTTVLGYDDRGQLTRADFSFQPDQSFAYDANGNPLRTGGTIAAVNRVSGDGTYTYLYDDEGNRVERTTVASGEKVRYEWDHRNRLIGTTTFDAGGTVIASTSQRYDDFGWKVAATRDADGAGVGAAQTEVYIHDRDDIAMVFDVSGTLKETYLHGAGMDAVLAEQRGSELRWSLADHQGTVRDVADATGTLLNHVRYDAFGRITDQTDASKAPRFTYTGRELDAVVGLMDYRARWYDVELGRFVSLDPIGFAAGDPNLYRYVSNNPFGAVDPSGLKQRNVAQTIKASIGVGIGTTGAIAKVAWDNTLGVAFDAGMKIGEDVSTLINQGSGAMLAQMARREREAELAREQRMREAMDPCSDLLHTLTTLNTLPARTGRKIRDAVEAWGDEVARKYESDSFADNVGAGYTFSKPVLEAALVVVPPVLGAAGAVAELVSASRAARAEKFAMETIKETEKALMRGRGLGDRAAKHYMATGLGYSERKALMGALRIEESAAVARAGSGGIARGETAMERYRSIQKMRETNLSDWEQTVAEMDLGKGLKRMAEDRTAARIAAGQIGMGERFSNAVSAIGDSIAKRLNLNDRFNNWVKNKKVQLLDKAGGYGEFAGSQLDRQIIEDTIREYNLGEISVRAGDSWTTRNIKWGERIGLAAKPETYKGKTIFGIAPKREGLLGRAFTAVSVVWEAPLLGFEGYMRKNFYRGDLDIARITRFENGVLKELNNTESIDIILSMNRRKVAAGGLPSFNHGAHATMNPLRGGYLDRFVSGKIGDPGAVTRFAREAGTGGRIARTEMTAAQVHADWASSRASVNWQAEWGAPAARASAPQRRSIEVPYYHGPGEALPEDVVARGAGRRAMPAQQPAAPIQLTRFAEAAPPTAANGMPRYLGADAEAVVRQSIARGRYDRFHDTDADTPMAFVDSLIKSRGKDPENHLGDMWERLAQRDLAGGRGVVAEDVDLSALYLYRLSGGSFDVPRPLQLTSVVPKNLPKITAQPAIPVHLSDVWDPASLRSVPLRMSKPSAEFLELEQRGVNLFQMPEAVRSAEMLRRAEEMQYQRFRARGGATLVAGEDGSWVVPRLAPNTPAYVNPDWLRETGLVPQDVKLVVPSSPKAGAMLRTEFAGPIASVSPPSTLSMGSASSPGSSSVLSLLGAARRAWSDVAGSGDGVLSISLSDLPPGELGRAWITQIDADGLPSEGRIVLDVDGDGRGWFVDPTPLDASEFKDPASPAIGRYDLFTVLTHEVGHVLGLMRGYAGYDRFVAPGADGSLRFVSGNVSVLLTEDGQHIADSVAPGDLMSATLAPGERRLPSALNAAMLAAVRTPDAGGAPGQSVTVNIGPASNGAGLPSGPVNGSFAIADPLAAGFGWTTSGSATVVGGQAVLAENGMLAARFTQSFTLPAGTRSLVFDIVATEFAANAGGPQDSFEVALLDSDTLAPLGATLPLAGSDALLNIQSDGTVVAAPQVHVTGLVAGKLAAGTAATVTILVDALPAGQDVALYLDLLGLGAIGSRVTVDNVRLSGNQTPTVTPLPLQTVNQGATLVLPLTGIDADGDALTFSLVAPPAGAVIDGLGRLVWTASGAPRDVTFTVRATDAPGAVSAPQDITVRVANVAPVAVDDSATVAEDTPITIAPLGNDTDAGGDALTLSLVAGPSSGVAVVNADGTVTYTPGANFSGTDTFTYRAGDGVAQSNVATVQITVTPVNDAPVVTPVALQTVNQGATLVLPLAGADIESDALTFSLVAPPAGAVIDGLGRLVWTASGAPRDVTFTVRATDAPGAVSAPQAITVRVANVAPVAVDDSATVAEDTPITIAPLGNDTDAGGDALTLSLVAGPTSGIAVVNADGTVTYTPGANFSGSDTFTYRLSDGVAQSNVATVQITVTPVNDAPVVTPVALQTVNQGATLVLPLAGTDIESDALTFSLVAPPAGAVIDVLRQLVWTASGAPRDVTFTVRATDAPGAVSAPQAITVRVANVAPVAVDDTATVAEDTPITIAPLGNDTDAGGDALTLSIVAGPANGSVVVNADGTVTYTPGANFSGSDTFTYRAGDGVAQSNVATVQITVTPVNDAPVLAPVGLITVQEDSVASVQLSATDVDSPAISYVLDSAPAGATVDASGRVTWTASGPTRDVVFTARAVDGAGASSAASSFTVRVLGVSTVPVSVTPTPSPNAAAVFDTPDPIRLRADPPRAVEPFVPGGRAPLGATPVEPVTVLTQSFTRASQPVAVVRSTSPQAPAVETDARRALARLVEEPRVERKTALQVLGVVATDRGVWIRFTAPLDVARLTAGAVVLARDGQPVAGRLVPDGDGLGVRFEAQEGLARGDYRLVLRGSAFVTPEGVALDGTYSGRAGSDYEGLFSIAVPGAVSDASLLPPIDPAMTAADGLVAGQVALAGTAAVLMGAAARRPAGWAGVRGERGSAGAVRVLDRAEAAFDFEVESAAAALASPAKPERARPEWTIRL